MSKNAVYDPVIPYRFNLNSELKRLSILFDKIFIRQPAIPNLKPYEFLDKNIAKEESTKSLYNEVKVFEYLKENKIIEEYSYIPFLNNERLTEEESNYLNKYTDDLSKLNSYEKVQEHFENNFDEQFNKTLLVDDINARIDALQLSERFQNEFYPVLKSHKSFQAEGKKTEVIKFVLSNIPQPDDSVSWEQIIDFRNDEEIRLKYLELINWVNEVAISNLSLNEIKERYEFLSLTYKRAFERHKLKSTLGIIEILVAAGLSFFSSNIPMALNLTSNIIKVGSTTLNLLQEEGKLPGKEIAYIYKAQQKF